ncbi:EAL domain-containing protein [Caenimonas terrae]|uniref:EAL domain-containing protein n=1 Tax=Caenimonas terrae TaxID=696074 RepID=A0ABW0NJV3_9BURK
MMHARGLFGRGEKPRRVMKYWLVNAALHLLVWSLLAAVVRGGEGNAVAAAVLIALSAAGLAGTFVLARFGYARGVQPGLLAWLQAWPVILSVAAAYAIVPEVRAALLPLPVVAVMFCSFGMTRPQGARVAVAVTLVLGLAMLALSLRNPAVFVPAHELFHFGILAGMLAATAFLTGEFQKLRARLHEQKEEMQLALGKISLIATLDELTDLPNRRHMKEIIANEVERNLSVGKSLCLVLIDIDFFKNINDSYGHNVGDQVLRAFADRAAAALRTSDVIARWGGEEFLLLLPATDEAAADLVLRRLREQVNGLRVDGLPDALTITFSAGMAWLTPGISVNEAITQADRAMYRSKQQGRNASRVFNAQVDGDVTPPAYAETTQLNLLASTPAPDLSDVAILVVEDDDLQREVMLVLLQELGARHPLFAHDGHSALVQLANAARPVQVVITDLNMPGMDGIEFIRQLGESRAAVSIVLMSAVNNTVLKGVEKVAQAHGLALLGVLPKPVRRRDLARVLAAFTAAPQPAPGKGVATFEQFSAEELQQALANREFEPFFQPKVSLQTGTIKGYEALARWRRPGLGIISPGSFIGVMEQSALIDELTYVMLDKSVAACSQWQSLGLDYGVSINVSVLTLSQPDCAQRVLRIVKDHGVDPSLVTIEMTESSTDATGLKTVLANLSRLRINGFGLSIDDYGTGYSSMDRLARIAFTELKIDQSFVAEAQTNASAMAIMQSSVSVAKVLHLVSVAEGVETKAQWDLVRGTGCELAQGYFISRPVEACAVPGMALEWLTRIQAGDVQTMDILIDG